MLLQYYLEQLQYKNMPDYLYKYLKDPRLLRLRNVGYFCGMDYASKKIYNFQELISRFDHSLTTALLTEQVTNDKRQTIAALYHDISTPCFSHVIDYMNQDYAKQESTEEYTEEILKRNKYLKKCLEEDHIEIDDLINFKKFSIVDNERPKCCADRLDGIILTGMAWTKDITKEDIFHILNDITIFKNEEGNQEIGFQKDSVVLRVMEVNQRIDSFCHSKEDHYMMQLLADITKLALEKKYFNYEDLYRYNELQLFHLLKKIPDKELQGKIFLFEHMDPINIPDFKNDSVKVRALNPLVNGKRYR